MTLKELIEVSRFRDYLVSTFEDRSDPEQMRETMKKMKDADLEKFGEVIDSFDRCVDIIVDLEVGVK